MTVLHHYDENHNETSALAVLPFILDLVCPASIVDVGCGVGQWLKVAGDLGVNDIVGLDGPHVPLDRRMIPPDCFREVDLTRPPSLGRKFDLALSLEVAEHLGPEDAETFVSYLVSLSDTIVFSAAIPGQTGENHRNEQPHEYWVELFDKCGFQVLDPFRPRFWNNPRINWWYRQNMYLFVIRSKSSRFSCSRDAYTAIHPEMLKMYLHILENARSQGRGRHRRSILGMVRRMLGRR